MRVMQQRQPYMPRRMRKIRSFISFYRSIEAYKKSLGTQNDLLVLDADGDFLRYLNNSGSQVTALPL